MNVLFRADASMALGSGHVQRCLALAAALSAKGASCNFAARDLSGNANALIKAAGHSVFVLPPQPADPQNDAAETVQAIADLGTVDLVIVDHYALDRDWEDAFRPYAHRCAVIDDLANRPHRCDVLIDVSQAEDRAAQYEPLVPVDALLLLGPRYAILRPEFRSIRATMRQRSGALDRVLISFGAIDADNHSELAWRAVRAVATEAEIDIVLGGNALHLKHVAEAIRTDTRTHLHVDTPAMAKLMAAADLAIGAGGTTTWERACLGLPAIVTAIADNQRDNIRALAETGAALSVAAGDGYAEQLKGAMASLKADPSRLVAMSKAAGDLVDGKGAERLAAILLRPRVTMRSATIADCESIWRWRNADFVLQGSKTPAPVSLPDHRAWFEAVLKDANRRVLIGEADGEPVGVLRFDLLENEATASVYLTPQGRGRGIGPELLIQGQIWLRSNAPHVVRIKAEIRSTNEASIEAFKAARYRRTGDLYVRELKA
ncbi:MAG TPA: UDP-2,4-diacetamido-2,4,6-trideoxy-beta-L-altropyranose hydrolase [Dongiaceae bacterium]|nr:UDP-2,4-diacetamido-2,4,6-trideoxy-beta-L-altropyranose hydrolase [Dongiaceae bacterium]